MISIAQNRQQDKIATVNLGILAFHRFITSPLQKKKKKKKNCWTCL